MGDTWPKTRQLAGFHILGYTWYFVYRQLRGSTGAFEGGNCEKTSPYGKDKSALWTIQCTVSQVNKNKNTRFSLRITFAFTVLARFGDFYLFTDYKKMLGGKSFGSNEEITTEIYTYFAAKDKSFYEKEIETLEKC